MPRNNPLDELAAAEVFLAVVTAESFSRAAKALGRSPSSVSRTVAELEETLGAQLFARTTRRLHLTEAGALYAQHAQPLLDARRVAHDAVTELVGGVPRGHLRVSMPVAVGERLLAPALPAFRQRYPELRLQIDLSNRNVPLVRGGYDLAIRVGRLADTSLRARRLGSVPVRLVASPGYLAAHGAPTHPEDLRSHPAIALGPLASPVDWSFFKGDAVVRVPIDGVVHTTSPSLAARLARDGLGVLRVIEWVVADELASGALVPILTAWICDDPREGGVPVHVVYSQTAGVEPPLKSRVFVAMIAEVMAREVLSPVASEAVNPGAMAR
ncbi:MAG: LysR family transcriptional regulator [Deltaproteobacteria bacterium]|nr:MAG: LysR family transcriptional regulator [Deltaproteobacteria bacterium]